MGLFRKKITRPLPKGAALHTRDGERFAQWTMQNGAHTEAPVTREPGAEWVRIESATWYGRIRLEDGSRLEFNTLCRDKSTAETWLAAKRKEQERIRAGVVAQAELDTAKAAVKPLADAIVAYSKTLRGKGWARRHIADTTRYLECAREALGWPRAGQAYRSPSGPCATVTHP